MAVRVQANRSPTRAAATPSLLEFDDNLAAPSQPAASATPASMQGETSLTLALQCYMAIPQQQICPAVLAGGTVILRVMRAQYVPCLEGSNCLLCRSLCGVGGTRSPQHGSACSASACSRRRPWLRCFVWAGQFCSPAIAAAAAAEQLPGGTGQLPGPCSPAVHCHGRPIQCSPSESWRFRCLLHTPPDSVRQMSLNYLGLCEAALQPGSAQISAAISHC